MAKIQWNMQKGFVDIVDVKVGSHLANQFVRIVNLLKKMHDSNASSLIPICIDFLNL